MAALATTVETYASHTASLRQRAAIQAKLPIVHSSKADSGSVTPPESLSAVADLTFHSPLHVLTSLRIHVLAYLADLESGLTSLDPSLLAEGLKVKGEAKVEEAMAWISTGLEMLDRIRVDVISHLPELDTVSGGDACHPPSQDTSDAQSHSHSRMNHLLSLSEHLHSLQAHLCSYELPQGVTGFLASVKPHASLHELIELSLAPKFPVSGPGGAKEAEADSESSAVDIARALVLSSNGAKLIEYDDLPAAWQHNPFVTRGYRYGFKPSLSCGGSQS